MRRNTKVIPLYRTQINPPLAPFTQTDGVPMTAMVNGFGAQWVTLMAVDAVGNPVVASFVGDDSDNVAQRATGDLLVMSRGSLFDGTNWDRWRMASSIDLAAVSGQGAGLVNGPGQRAAFQTPAAATQATCNFAAIAGARNICKSITWAVEAIIAQGDLTLVLRDGATGVGAILWAMRAGSYVIGTSGNYSISGLDIVGSVNTAMTLEFTAAPAAGNFESVAMTGIFVN
jgi:hypothetical protein